MSNQITLMALIILLALVTGCGDSGNPFIVTGGSQPAVEVEVQPIQEASPVAVDYFITALGNSVLTRSAAEGVLANDTINDGVISRFDTITTQGGTVVLNDDGSFVYSAPAGVVGADSFTYTLSNDDGESTATVVFDISNRAYYVNNLAPAGGDGSQGSPFNDVADALAVARAEEIVFVFRGDGTPLGDITLPDGIQFIGEASGLVLAQQIVPEGQAPEINGLVTLGNDNTVSGFRFTGTNGAIFGDEFSGCTITGNTIQSSGGVGINLDDGSGTLTISNNLIEMQDGRDGIETFTENDCELVVTDNVAVLLASGDGNGSDAFDFRFDTPSTSTLTFSGNRVTGAGTDSGSTDIDSGLVIDCTSSNLEVTATVSDNVVTGVSEAAYEFLTNGTNSTLRLTATMNVAGVCDEGFGLASRGVMFAELVGNSVTQSRDEGIAVLASSP